MFSYSSKSQEEGYYQYCSEILCALTTDFQISSAWTVEIPQSHLKITKRVTLKVNVDVLQPVLARIGISKFVNVIKIRQVVLYKV